jgi:hypothetical protein
MCVFILPVLTRPRGVQIAAGASRRPQGVCMGSCCCVVGILRIFYYYHSYDFFSLIIVVVVVVISGGDGLCC